MTYPHPSRGYQELVCTAGITESSEWVRLYPIDLRYRPTNQRFQKYQWISVELEPKGAGNDQRKESRRPNLDSIELVGRPLSTKHDWRDRREIIDNLPHLSINQLKAAYEQDKTSLGIVRPTEVLDMQVNLSKAPNWKAEWQNLFQQKTLFGPPQKPLRKLPYTFHYVFRCEDSDKEHTAMCEDWELGALFLKESERLGSDERAAESVRRKYLEELCNAKRDTRFFVGTFFPYNTWLVLGVFWPPKTPPTLF